MIAYIENLKKVPYRYCRIAGFILLCASVIPKHAHSTDLPYISLQSALLFSLHESTKIKIAGEKEEQALHSVDEAKAKYYPDIQFLVEAGREYNNPATSDDAVTSGEKSNANNSVDINLTLRQMLFDRTKTSEVLRVQQLKHSKNIESSIIEQDVIMDTLKAYINVLDGQKNASAAAEMLVSIKGFADKIGVAYKAGSESKAKYDYVSARLALAGSKYNIAVSSYQNSMSSLEALTGRLPEFLAIEPDELSVQDYDLSVYKHLATKKNSELELIESNIHATKIDYDKQRATYLPKINLVLEAGQSFDKGGKVGRVREASTMVQFQYDVFKGFGRRAAKKRISSKLRELEYEKEDLIKDIIKKVKVNYNEIEAIKGTIFSKEKEVDSYLSLRQISQQSSKEGEVDLFQSIENEEQLYDALSQIYKFQSNAYIKSYKLLKLIGSLKSKKFCESCN